MSNLQELYQEMILDHGRRPRFRYKPVCCDAEQEGYNPLCGDKVHLYATVKNNIVEEMSFEGSGCAISMASTSLMLEIAQKKSIANLHDLFTAMHNMIVQDTACDPKYEAILAKCQILKGVHQYPARVKCATLPWHTLETLLKKIETNYG